MPIAATCPGCGKIISAPDSAAGHKAKCPHCGQVVTFPDNPAAALAAAVRAEEKAGSGAESSAGHPAGATPTPARAAAPSRHSTTTVSRMLARTSPYNTLRLLAAIIFGVGVTVSVLVLLGALAALVMLATRGRPWEAAGVFAGALILAVMLFLGAKTVSELVRLWADVGDRTRHMAQMLEESLDLPRDNSR
jgi:phage FluMu protein Com